MLMLKMLQNFIKRTLTNKKFNNRVLYLIVNYKFLKVVEIVEENKNFFFKVIHKIQNSQFRYIKKYKGNKTVNKLAV